MNGDQSSDSGLFQTTDPGSDQVNKDTTVDGIDFRPLEVATRNPFIIDNREVYYKGFLSLNEEDKARVLMGYLLLYDAPSPTNIEDLNPQTVRDKHLLNKDKKLFNLKFYATAAVIVLIVVAGIAIIGTFMYLSLDKGVLDENGVLTGILSTLQEVFRILFTDPTSMN